MKKSCLVILAFFIGYFTNGQSGQPCVPCLPNGITFQTQAQIDNFSTNYPNCTEIEGDVLIFGNNINNLNGLNVLTAIRGALSISSCGTLTSLAGLDSMTVITSLEIHDCPNLASLMALQNLTSISDGWFTIDGCDALVELTGMENLVSIGWGLWIKNNSALTSLTGLDNLNHINQCTWINNNNLLQNLTGLESVNFAGDVYIYENDSLTSLTGFGIESTIIGDLYICDNPLLSTCDVPSICHHLENPARVEIRDNSVGCNSLEEVNDSCNIVPANQELEMIGFTMYPNPASTTITIEMPADGFLSIINTRGQRLLRKEITEPKASIDVSRLKSGIYIVKVVGDIGVMVEKFIKQ